MCTGQTALAASPPAIKAAVDTDILSPIALCTVHSALCTKLTWRVPRRCHIITVLMTKSSLFAEPKHFLHCCYTTLCIAFIFWVTKLLVTMLTATTKDTIHFRVTLEDRHTGCITEGGCSDFRQAWLQFLEVSLRRGSVPICSSPLRLQL